jgi:hypothetical protein
MRSALDFRPAVAGQIGEQGEAVLEQEPHGAARALALLGELELRRAPEVFLPERGALADVRSEEHTSELQSLIR